MNEDGICTKCPSYEGADPADTTKCIPRICDGNSYVTIDSNCEFCPNYTKINIDGRTCEASGCTELQKLNIDGTCENCPSYSR